MRLWRSVVGKLWATILLLVSFVLFFLTILLLQFVENYHVVQAEKDLTQQATKVSIILESHSNKEMAQSIAWELEDELTTITIVEEEGKISYSPNKSDEQKLKIEDLQKENILSPVLKDRQRISKRMMFHEEIKQGRDAEYLIVGVPLMLEDGKKGAVFMSQSLLAVHETTKETMKFIFIAGGIAFILTTIFAFFLVTRITNPLRKMREVAGEVAKGKFDFKVPILNNDEIGELAVAINQMGKQLKSNLNALKQEKEQLSSILSSMADGVITLNIDSTILVTNPPAERFLQAWYYENKMQLMDGEELPPAVKDLFHRVVQNEKEEIFELSLQGRTWVILMSPLYNQSHVRGAVAVLRDMTEERRLDKLRDDFIANVSHELRTPIAMMQGYSEAIVDDIAGSDDEKKEIASVIYDESQRMGRLVNELLDIARMEAGHYSLNLEDIDMEEFIEKIKRKFQGLAKEKNINITTKYKLIDDTFLLDPDRIEQVLTNLIDNAIRHTNHGGNLTISSTDSDYGLRIDVQDTGKGINEEDLPFVFERFYKADKARTRGRSGTGLGLAIAKNIIDAHKGTITVHSKVNEGTTFIIVIPRKSDSF